METATFRSFPDPDAARELATWLNGRGIAASIGDSPAYFDPSFANSILSRSWTVQLAPADFLRAEQLLAGFFEMRLRHLPGEYYLYAFSDEELRAIFREPDRWGDLDKVLAQKLLADRGSPIDDDEIEELRSLRNAALAKPDTADAGATAIWGYGFCVLCVAFSYSRFGLGCGALAIMIGSFMATSTKTLPDGRVVDRYNAAGKRQGRLIVIFGGLSILIFLVVRLLYVVDAG